MKKPEHKPPFKWTGGKNRLWDKYENIFWPTEQFDNFVDLFCGAGSVSMWIRENYPNVQINMNDTNSELISMYNTIKNDYDEFEREYLEVVNKFVPLDKPARKLMYQTIMKEYCLSPEFCTETVNNARLYFMLQTNFNGIWKGYKKWRGRYSTPPGTLTMKAHFFDPARTRAFRDLLKDANITNLDFSEVESTGKTFWYADPPYRACIVDYKTAKNTDGFSEKDQKRLAEFLKTKADGGDFIAESNKEIGDGFWSENFGIDYNINPIDNVSVTAGRGSSFQTVSEVLITNF